MRCRQFILFSLNRASKLGTAHLHRKEKAPYALTLRRCTPRDRLKNLAPARLRMIWPANDLENSDMAGSNIIDLNPELLAAATESKAWPFEEAKKIIERYKGTDFPQTILFETGYGPSGLPHIGTFGEVARTTMVRTRVPRADADKSRRGCSAFPTTWTACARSRERAGPRALEPHLQQAADRRAQSVRRRLSRASATTTTPCCAASSTPSASTTSSPAPPSITSRAGSTPCCCRAAERYDEIMAVMLPTLGAGAAGDLFARSCRSRRQSGRGALRADEGGRRQGRHHHLRRRGRHRDHAAGHRRQREAAVEAGFRHALGGARRRFRDVRQGPPDQHADLRPDLRDPRRAGAGALRLRAVPRRERREDLEVEGQRPDHRRVADLCADREPRALHVPEAAAAKRLYFDVIPRAVDEYYTFARRLSAAGLARSGSTTRSGTSTAASRRRSTCRCRSRCCSTWSAPPTRRTRTCSGASSRAMRRA